MTEKVSFYANNKTWDRFKNQVFRASGTVRTLSSELNKIIDDYTLSQVEEALKNILQKKNLTSFTLEEIKENRPTPPVLAEKIIREMRT